MAAITNANVDVEAISSHGHSHGGSSKGHGHSHDHHGHGHGHSHDHGNVKRKVSQSSNEDRTPIPSGLSTPHCHDDLADDADTGSVSRRKLLIASLLCLGFMIAEIVGGVLSNSLAIMTDALHLLTDLVGFGISVAAITLARRPATRRMTFGWYRAEVLGALISVLLVWGITAILVFMAIERIISNNYDIEPQIMLITSSLGVGINLVMGIQLQHGGHGHSHGIGGGHGHSHGGSSKAKSGNHGHSHGSGAGHGHSHGSPQQRHRTGSDPQYGSISETAVVTGDLEPIGHRRSSDNARQAAVSLSSPTTDNDHKHEPQAKHDLQTFAAGDCHDVEEGHHDHDHDDDHDDHDHETGGEVDMNVRAAIIHILGDLGQSIGVMFAALIIYFGGEEFKIADPICTFIFSIVVLFTTITIMRDVFHILMEGTPRNVDYEKMQSDLLKIQGVRSVHNLRIWALTVSKVAASAHIGFTMDEQGSEQTPLSHDEVLLKCRQVLRQKYGIADLTLQVEQHTEAMDICGKCQPPK